MMTMGFREAVAMMCWTQGELYNSTSYLDPSQQVEAETFSAGHFNKHLSSLSCIHWIR